MQLKAPVLPTGRPDAQQPPGRQIIKIYMGIYRKIACTFRRSSGVNPWTTHFPCVRINDAPNIAILADFSKLYQAIV